MGSLEPLSNEDVVALRDLIPVVKIGATKELEIPTTDMTMITNGRKSRKALRLIFHTTTGRKTRRTILIGSHDWIAISNVTTRLNGRKSTSWKCTYEASLSSKCGRP